MRSIANFFAASVALAVLVSGAQAGPAEDRVLCSQADGRGVAVPACSRLIERGARETPRDRAIYFYNRGSEYVVRKDFDRAIADFSQAISLEPTLSSAYLARGYAYYSKGEFGRSIPDFDAALRSGASPASVYGFRGFSHSKTGNIDLAIADYDQLIALQPTDAVAYNTRGQLYREKKDYDRAIADFSKALDLAPDNAVVLGNRGLSYTLKKKFEEALSDFRRAIEIDPKSSLLYSQRALAYNEMRDVDRALSDLQRALDLDSTNLGALNVRAVMRNNRQEFDLALADLDKAIAINSTIASLFNNRGFAYNGKREFDKAIADFQRALAIDPKLDVPHNNIGLSNFEMQNYDLALAEFERAITLNPRSVEAYNNRGRTFFFKKEYEKAIRDYDRAIDIDPSQLITFANRAESYARNFDYGRAVADYDRALAFAPKDDKERKKQESAKSGRAVVVAILGELAERDKKAELPVKPQRRVALVIGNSAYESTLRLTNPVRDADAVGDALRNAGFEEVKVAKDLNRAAMISALKAFSATAAGADWAVVYYAGHGIEFGGTNFLVPTDAKLETDRDAEDETVLLTRVMSALDDAKGMRLVILDACRNNPFVQMRRTVATRAVRAGLAPVEPRRGVLVAYAARDGETALDGDGENSPFALSLSRRISQPNLEINKLFRLVRDDVMKATDEKQEPFLYGSLGADDYVLNPK